MGSSILDSGGDGWMDGWMGWRRKEGISDESQWLVG